MLIPVTAMKLVCDCCGEIYETFHGWTCIVGDDGGKEIEGEALCDDYPWLRIGDKHYCPKCYEVDDNDIATTKDGKMFDMEIEEEIKKP